MQVSISCKCLEFSISVTLNIKLKKSMILLAKFLLLLENYFTSRDVINTFPQQNVSKIYKKKTKT